MDKDWLQAKGIEFPTNALKAELYSIIQRLKPSPGYVVDDMAAAAGKYSVEIVFHIGHEVVQLPVAHCTLNPIELAWAQVKGHIKANTHAFNLHEVEQLSWERFDVVTPDFWMSLVQNVQIHYEDHYWSSNGLYEELVDEFIFELEVNQVSLMIPINLIIVPMTNSSFVKRFFQNLGGFIAAQNSQKTIPDYYFLITERLFI